MDSSRKGFVKKWSEILIFLTLLWIFIQYHIFYSIVHRDVCRMKELMRGITMCYPSIYGIVNENGLMSVSLQFKNTRFFDYIVIFAVS